MQVILAPWQNALGFYVLGVIWLDKALDYISKELTTTWMFFSELI